MRNHRNPRYAPEYLERKLSPSALVSGLAPPAIYDTTTANNPPPTLPPTTLPPIVQPPIVPYGPTVPA